MKSTPADIITNTGRTVPYQHAYTQPREPTPVFQAIVSDIVDSLPAGVAASYASGAGQGGVDEFVNFMLHPRLSCSLTLYSQAAWEHGKWQVGETRIACKLAYVGSHQQAHQCEYNMPLGLFAFDTVIGVLGQASTRCAGGSGRVARQAWDWARRQHPFNTL